MSHITSPTDFVAPPTAIAALLLLAIPRLKLFGLPHPSASEAIKALDVSRGQAYALKTRFQERLGDLIGPTGRPPKIRTEPAPPQLATKLLAYLYEHPGAVSGSPQRHRYSRGFRLFVLKLIETHPEVERKAMARVLALSLPTLKDWLKGGALDVVEPEPDEPPEALTTKDLQVATLLAEYQSWEGAFSPFCDHVQRNLHLPFGRTIIATILFAHGARTPPLRLGRSPDESAARESFQTFFPNAQWVGDGSELAITLNGTRHVCNLELIVDPFSGAFVGANIRPTEDSAAVVESFDDASKSTATTPISLLLDNKPSNHTSEVTEAISPTTIIRSTLSRPQNKAHVEGGFGLLKSTLGEVDITTSTPEQLAHAILAIMVITWGRTINHRPRSDRKGRSRVELLKCNPTPEEVERAQMALSTLLRRQELARRTLAARQDPEVRAFIADTLILHKLEDPKGHFLSAIARYPLDAVVEAAAVFKGRQRAGSLPDGVDVRYLLGITRNIAQDREALEIAEALWDERKRAGSLLLRRLRERQKEIERTGRAPEDIVAAYIDEAVTAIWLPKRSFWLKVAADHIARQTEGQHKRLYRLAARRIQASYQLSNRNRQVAIRILAANILPLR